MIKSIFVAGILSILAVGMFSSPARAQLAVPAGDGVVELFGVRLCLADAPSDATCDVRLPTEPQTGDRQVDAMPARWSLLGIDICIGERSGCDITIPRGDRHARL